MKENRVQALAEFLKIVPESVRAKGKHFSDRFTVLDEGERLSGKTKGFGGQILQARFDFDPKVFNIVNAFCTCNDVRRGAICAHLCGLAEQLIAEFESDETSENALDFIDKHLNASTFQSPPFRLSIVLNVESSELEPEVQIHKFVKEGAYGAGRRFTANDSYKLNKGEPADQNLLDFISQFRQIFFYSNYTPAQRYNWGFWLSILNHPRVSLDDKPIKVQTANLRLALTPKGEKYRLTIDHGVEGVRAVRFYEVEGGLLGLSRASGALLICQVDYLSRGILLEIQQLKPLLSKPDLLSNLSRLEKLQALFDLQLPEDLSGIIHKVPPKLILLLDLEVGKGLVLSPRASYAGSKSRVIPGSSGQYLSTGEDAVVERDYRHEAQLLEDFLNYFPFEELPDRNHDIVVSDLERALVLLDWLRNQDQWELEWIRKEPKIHKITSVQGLRVQIDSKAWLKIHLMADDQTFSIQHFPDDDQHLAGTQFVAVGDQEWIQIDHQVRQQLNQFKMAVVQENKAMKLKKAALAVLAHMEDVTWEGDSDWLDRIEEWRGVRDEDFKPSKKLHADLRNYQLEGYRWLRRMSELGVGACLADDMGLGKTVQALAVLIDRMKEGPVLVVTPASVGYNWKEEIERFAPSLKPILYAEGRRTKQLKKLKQGQIIIISYALVLKDIEKLGEVAWGTLVLDEAQFIKNALSQTAIAVSKLDRAWTLALTGTPLENHLGELWSIFRMLNPELLGTWEAFRKTYVTAIERGRDPKKLENLRRLIRPFILRRTKQNVLDDLPARSDIILKVQLGDAQRVKYEGERNRILSQLDEIEEKLRFKLLAAITRLRQLACHPALCEARYKGESAKLKLFSELVEELVSEDHRVLVFSQFTSFLGLIARELNRIHVPHVMMTGETPVKHRQSIIKRFQKGEVPVFLVSLRAGGTGLNLTNANYVIHMDPWWNPAVEEQATDRAHRIGQTKAVTVYRLVATNTIEEAILNIHERKKDLVESLLEGQEGVSKLSIGDLVSLIKDDIE